MDQYISQEKQILFWEETQILISQYMPQKTIT
jgi:hypothetical protein